LKIVQKTQSKRRGLDQSWPKVEEPARLGLLDGLGD
jgi:hypothetical protein